MAQKKPSNAQVQFDSLSSGDARSLLDEVFGILEYDADGNPGASWSSDTTQSLGETFNAYGITFTEPED